MEMKGLTTFITWKPNLRWKEIYIQTIQKLTALIILRHGPLLTGIEVCSFLMCYN